MIRRSPTQASGDAAEDRALAFLAGRGLRLPARNDYGGAAASVGLAKQRRLRREAQRYLNARFGDRWPACRFDVCAIDATTIDWIRDAF